MTATGSMAVRLTMAAATGTAATGMMTIAAVGMEKATATAEATGAVIAESGVKPGSDGRSTMRVQAFRGRHFPPEVFAPTLRVLGGVALSLCAYGTCDVLPSLYTALTGRRAVA